MIAINVIFSVFCSRRNRKYEKDKIFVTYAQAGTRERGALKQTHNVKNQFFFRLEDVTNKNLTSTWTRFIASINQRIAFVKNKSRAHERKRNPDRKGLYSLNTTTHLINHTVRFNSLRIQCLIHDQISDCIRLVWIAK